MMVRRNNPDTKKLEEQKHGACQGMPLIGHVALQSGSRRRVSTGGKVGLGRGLDGLGVAKVGLGKGLEVLGIAKGVSAGDWRVLTSRTVSTRDLEGLCNLSGSRHRERGSRQWIGGSRHRESRSRGTGDSGEIRDLLFRA